MPQFPLSRYLTWSVLPKSCGPLGTLGPASLSCPYPDTTCTVPLGGGLGRVLEPPGRELPATWPWSPGISRPDRAPGQLWSPGVCFLPSLSTLCVCVCVFSPCFLTEGILPSWLRAPGVVTPGPTLEWQPLPAVTSSPACPAPAHGACWGWDPLQGEGDRQGPYGALFRRGRALPGQGPRVPSPGGCANHLLISPLQEVSPCVDLPRAPWGSLGPTHSAYAATRSSFAADSLLPFICLS